MRIHVLDNIKIDERRIAKIDMNGNPTDIRIVKGGENPVDGKENYLVIRAFNSRMSIVTEEETYAKSYIERTEYGYDTILKYRGKVIGVSNPDGIVDPYFHDLQLSKMVRVHTTYFDFDVDNVKDKIPNVGDYIEGEADFMGIFIKKSQVKEYDIDGAVHINHAIPNYIGSFISPCTTIAECFLKAEAMNNQEKFLNGIFNGRERFIAEIFSRGAKLIGVDEFSENDFHLELFTTQEKKSICAVIHLPGASEEFDYSVIAFQIFEDLNNVRFYAMEKGDSNNYLFREARKDGHSHAINVVSNVSECEAFEYVCNYLRNK